MALAATVHKLDLGIADMRRNHYGDYALTLARHPSETEPRLMVRALAFALHASEQLSFSRGLSSSDEPALWEQSLSGEQLLWVMLGQPDLKWLKKACGQARQVSLICYGGRQAQSWWDENRDALVRFNNLLITNFDSDAVQRLPQLLTRSMRLQCTVQEDQLWLSSAEDSVALSFEHWQQPDA